MDTRRSLGGVRAPPSRFLGFVTMTLGGNVPAATFSASVTISAARSCPSR
jgi:hypothetical protein